MAIGPPDIGPEGLLPASPPVFSLIRTPGVLVTNLCKQPERISPGGLPALIAGV